MLTALASLTLTGLLLGCGGGGGGDDSGSDDPFVQRTASANSKAAICAAPRSGNDPYNGNQPYPDRQGNIDNEKSWVKAFMGDIYLWYREIPNVNAAPYTTANYQGSVMYALDSYFQALKTRQTTTSGKSKDQFSFTYPTDQWDALSQGGITVGYGMQIGLLYVESPGKAVIAYSDPNTPATAASIGRGAEILAVDGGDVVLDYDSSTGDYTLNAGLYPSAEGEQHSFTLHDYGASSNRNVTLTAQQVTSTPVQNVHTLDTPSGRVGYMLFNDHIATAEGMLINAVTALGNAGISDLVLDMRYNGGGYLDIASELGYMIAGSARTSGKVFEKLSFNDKNPLAQVDGIATPFHAAAVGFDPSVSSGSSLPSLSLQRLFVLAGPGTCSASEAVINGLRGVNVDVVLIGDTTCGKPYGFFPTDNCGLSYFAIEFAGVNALGFGDYADGFAPNCAVDDDLGHALGDPNEALLATALSYRSNGSCAVTASRAASFDETHAAREPMKLLRSPLRENRILGRPK
ncbi:MAG: peptidase [Hydrocarboniphaga sp.]|uniref:S41 family peptidase n=1 Tax=Hydrocarboniphaga sp. TaxID=2033016 RepID=UPI0026283384|nr:S41 family peptidase [Hydrocarboniphaga sp.]MDB5972854.1 peptidase [Hydrocarboniphaga sp.]